MNLDPLQLPVCANVIPILLLILRLRLWHPQYLNEIVLLKTLDCSVEFDFFRLLCLVGVTITVWRDTPDRPGFETKTFQNCSTADFIATTQHHLLSSVWMSLNMLLHHPYANSPHPVAYQSHVTDIFALLGAVSIIHQLWHLAQDNLVFVRLEGLFLPSL